MERTSTRPLAVKKTITRNHKPKDWRAVLTDTQIIEETNNTTRQAQQSPSLSDHVISNHWGSEHDVKDTESDRLVDGLLSLLEKSDNELKFISAHASAPESTQKDGIVYDIEQMKAEDVNRTSLDIFARFIDSEQRSEYILCDEELSREPAAVVQDEVTEYFPELQEHETDTLSARHCSARNIMGHEYGVAPVRTETPLVDTECDYVQSILMDEIRINRNDNYSVQSWTNGTESSVRREPDFHSFQGSRDGLSERSDHVMMEMSAAEQAKDGNEIYVDQSDDEYPTNEYSEVEYDDDESTVGE